MACCSTASESAPRAAAGTPDPGPARLWATAAWALAAGLVGLYFLFPGDVAWINDEPTLLVGIAWRANQDGRLATHGLLGSFGVQYGPVPAWYYQLAWLVGRSLTGIVALKTATMVALLGLALWRLAALLGWRCWPLLFVLASPYVYHYSRCLWDNCFLLPLTAWLAYGYLRLLRDGRRREFVALVALAVVLLHVHLMTVLVLGPLAVCLLLFRRAWLAQHWRTVTASVTLGAAAMLPYALSQWRHVEHAARFQTADWSALARGIAWGGRYFSFWGMDYFLPELRQGLAVLPGGFVALLTALTALTLLFLAVGLGAAGRDLARGWRAGRRWTLADHGTVYALLVLAAVAGFTGLTRPQPHPHYVNAVWLAWFWFVWRGAEVLAPRRWAIGVAAVQLGAATLLLLAWAAQIHTHGGNRTPYYGATLRDQQALARRLAAYPASAPVQADAVLNYRLFPHALAALRLLAQRDAPPPAAGPPVRLVVQYRDPAPVSGWLDLLVLPAPALPK